MLWYAMARSAPSSRHALATAPPIRPRRGGPLHRALDQILDEADFAAHVQNDPLGHVRTYRRKADQEIAALVAATLAFGGVAQIRRSVARVLAALGPHPAATIRARDRGFQRELKGFVHRVYRENDVLTMLENDATLCRAHGSLAERMGAHFRVTGDLREALTRFADELRGPEPSRGLAHLIPDPRAGSACKRLHLYLRWMVRPADGVDLGIFRDIPPAALLIPVDTHILRIGQNLGLTHRRTADWRTAEEITATLRRFDPEDPVKYDFALCHFGVSQACPSRPDAAACRGCHARSVCTQWR